MSKVGGLQFSRPVFDWDAKDKLMELSQFKADVISYSQDRFVIWKTSKGQVY